MLLTPLGAASTMQVFAMGNRCASYCNLVDNSMLVSKAFVWLVARSI